MVLERQWAAVGHLQRTHIFGASQDAAKLQAAGLDLEIWEEDFSQKSDTLLIRMAVDHVYLQKLFFLPTIKIHFISWVKCNVEMTGLPYIHCHMLQGDEE